MSRPMFASPPKSLARRSAAKRSPSKPPLFATAAGSALNARAKPYIAAPTRPGTDYDACSTAFAITVSALPAPSTTRPFTAAVCETTASASWRERSASSRMCPDAPRNTIVDARAHGRPEKRSNVSSPIIISSSRSHVPSCTSPGVSKVLATSAPPRTKLRRSTPSKSACSIHVIPCFAKYCYGTS